MQVAAHLAAWKQRGGWHAFSAAPGPMPSGRGGSPPLGVPFLDQIPGFAAQFPGARLIVQVAWGQSLFTDVSLLNWTDITSSVMQDSERTIHIEPLGQPDQMSQPVSASIAFRVKNKTGDFSKGPQSRNYPNVTQGVPIRAMISLDGTDSQFVVQFWGEARSWVPTWDVTGGFAVVDVIANGIINRLQQGTQPVMSPLYRAIRYPTAGAPTPIEYWPLEDASDATAAASGLSGGQLLQINGSVTFADDSGISGSKALVTTNLNGQLQSGVINYSFPNKQYQLDFHFHVPANPSADTRIAQWRMSGGATLVLWYLTYSASGNNYHLKAEKSDSTVAIDISISPTSYTMVNNWSHAAISVQEVGGTINARVVNALSLGSNFSIGTGSVAGTLGTTMNYIALVNSGAASAGISNLGLGHLALWDAFDYTEPGNAAFGYRSESAYARLIRICAENGIPLQIFGDKGSFTGRCGIQSIDTVWNILLETIAEEQGLLGDGIGPGLYYVTRDFLYDQAAALTLDAAANDFTGPDDAAFVPVDDDTKSWNRMTVTQKNGITVTAEQVTGPLGTAKLGTRDQTPSFGALNVYSPADVPAFASWLLGQGTVDAYRYPAIHVDWSRRPALAAMWSRMNFGQEIDLANVSTYVTQHPAGLLRLLLTGSASDLSRFIWSSTANLISAEQWHTGVVADGVSAEAFDEFTGTGGAWEGKVTQDGIGNRLWRFSAGTSAEYTWGSGVGTIALSGALPTSRRMRVGDSTLPYWKDPLMIVDVFTDVLALGDRIEVCNLGRYYDANNYYQFCCQLKTDQTINAQIYVKIAGTDTLLAGADAPVPALTHVAGTAVRLWSWISGGRFRFAIGTPATGFLPTSWLLDVNDPTYSIAGGAGVRLNLSALNTNVQPLAAHFDNWQVYETTSTRVAGIRVGKTDAATTAPISPGDTSTQVSFTNGLAFSNFSGDYPQDFNIGGWRVPVSMVTGTSSPQILSINTSAVTRSIPAGSSVDIWQPGRVAL